MSHNSLIKTKINDLQAVKCVLKEMGLSFEEGRCLSMYDFLGEKRTNTAQVVVRRKYLDKVSNDLGFCSNKDGFYDIVISDFDKSCNTFDVDKFMRRYSELKLSKELTNLEKKLQANGYNEITQNTKQQGDMKIVTLKAVRITRRMI